MKVFDPNGRLLVAVMTNDGPTVVGWPLIYNPDDGGFKLMLTRQETGLNGQKVTTPYLADPSPKVQDDDDKKWRYVYYLTENGFATPYLSDTSDEIPGYQPVVYDIDDGNLRVMRSRTENGIPTPYWTRY